MFFFLVHIIQRLNRPQVNKMTGILQTISLNIGCLMLWLVKTKTVFTATVCLLYAYPFHSTHHIVRTQNSWPYGIEANSSGEENIPRLL